MDSLADLDDSFHAFLDEPFPDELDSSHNDPGTSAGHTIRVQPRTRTESEVRSAEDLLNEMQRCFSKEDKLIPVEKVVPLKTEVGKCIYRLIFEGSDVSKVKAECDFDHTMTFPMFETFGQWRELVFTMGRMFNRILCLDSLRELCGWALIALTYLLFKKPDPQMEKLSPEKRKRVLQNNIAILQHIFIYTSKQFDCKTLNIFIAYHGHEFFDQIFGLIHYKITAKNSRSTNIVQDVFDFLTEVAQLVTLHCYEVDAGIDETTIKTEALKSFFRNYSGFIAPRILYSVFCVQHRAQVVDFVQRHQTPPNADFRAYITNNFSFIFDYYMLHYGSLDRTRNWDVEHRVFHFCNVQASHFFKRKTNESILISVFHMATNREFVMEMLKRVAYDRQTEWHKMVEKSFLGLLITLRQNVIEQPYFGQRRKGIGAGLAAFFRIISPNLVNNHASEVCHTLWIMNSPMESFEDVWKVVVGHLDQRNLVNMRFRLLFYFLQVPRFEELAQAYLKELERKKRSGKFVEEIREVKLVYSALFHVKKEPNALLSVNKEVTQVALAALDDTPHLTPFVLPLIQAQVLSDSADYNAKAQVLDRIFRLVPQMDTLHELATLATYIGRATAVDPKKLMETPAWKDDSPRSRMSLVLDEKELVRRLLDAVFSWHVEAPSGGQADMASFCLQTLCHALPTFNTGYDRLLDEKPEIAKFKHSTLALKNVGGYLQVPVCTKAQVKSHGVWLVQWYRTLSQSIRHAPFSLLHCLSESYSGNELPQIFVDYLPVVVLRCLLEFDKNTVDELLVKEAQEVFAGQNLRDDISRSCQTIFQVFDDLNRVVARDRRQGKLIKDAQRDLIHHFMESSLSYRVAESDLMPASVMAAVSCDNYYRALKLIESYVIEKDHRGCPFYQRPVYELVQRLYFNLAERENNEGAYRMILRNDKPTDAQTIMSAQAQGDLQTIVPMIFDENREFMVQSLLHLDQPAMVLAYIEHKFSKEECFFLQRDYPDTYRAQCIAAVELDKWDLIDYLPEARLELTARSGPEVNRSDVADFPRKPSDSLYFAIDSDEEELTEAEKRAKRLRKALRKAKAPKNQREAIHEAWRNAARLQYDMILNPADDETEAAKRILDVEREVWRQVLGLTDDVDEPAHPNDHAEPPDQAQKRAADETVDALNPGAKRPRLSSIHGEPTSPAQLDDTDEVFGKDKDGNNKENDAKRRLSDGNIEPSSEDTQPATGQGPQAKFVHLYTKEDKPAPPAVADRLEDRFDLLRRFETESLAAKAQRHYRDFRPTMQTVEALTKWTPFEDYHPIYDDQRQHTFVGDLTAILRQCREKRFEDARTHMKMSQVHIMHTLNQQSVDNSRPYQVGYEFVQNLHTLEDLKIAWPELREAPADQIWGHNNAAADAEEDVIPVSQGGSVLARPPLALRVEDIMDAWTTRDALLRQTPHDMEPILLARRLILRSLPRPPLHVRDGLTRLLVQSARVARENDMSHTVLPFITQAKKYGVKSLDLETEKAYYYHELKNSYKASYPVQVMARAISDFFPKFWRLFKELTLQIEGASKNANRRLKGLYDLGTKQSAERFEAAMVTTMEMMATDQICGAAKLMNLCKNLETMGCKSELFFYRYATFVDDAYDMPHPEAARLVIRLCAETMNRGTTYQHEVMPRMVTAWLDTPRESQHFEAQKRQNPKSARVLANNALLSEPFFTATPDPPNVLVRKAFADLGARKFFVIYPLLATRVSKASREDREVVQHIMSELLIAFPHQCALLSMGEVRCKEKKYMDRVQAMQTVFDMATHKNPKLREVLETYKFLSDSLSKLATHRSSAHKIDLSRAFPELLAFVERGELRRSAVKRASAAAQRRSIPMFFSYLAQPFREIPADAVLIDRINPDAVVLNSMAAPKRLKLRGSDGEEYVVLCKPNDELRKDMRFLELANMLNRRMETSRFTKNRDYRIRTYHVIPLEEKGGLIEWVHHMSTVNECINKGACNDPRAFEKLRQQIIENRLNKRQLYEAYLNRLIPMYSLLMGKYLRHSALNPAAHFQKQRNYTITTAVMNALGHVIGLGDRHLGNILIDETNGDIMHVDFNLIFNGGEMLGVPERVPFRLTRNIVDGFGPNGVEGRYRSTFERIMKFLRSEKAAILRLLKSFGYDPLIELQPDDNTMHASHAGRSSSCPVRDRIELVRDRLDGYLHTILQPKTGPIGDDRILVSTLIDQAMDEDTLSQMYVGWSAFI